MQTTAQNIKLIERKLARFRGMRGFPETPDALTHRATLLCRLVRNQTVGEIREAAGLPADGIREDLPRGVRPTREPLDKNLNDLDFLLDLVEESSESFPPHAALRRLYSKYFSTPDEQRIAEAQAVLSGEEW